MYEDVKTSFDDAPSRRRPELPGAELTEEQRRSAVEEIRRRPRIG
jgi:hypothetical protein